MTHRVFNFSAGPAILPLSVLEEAARGVVALEGCGLSVLEISHRSKDFEAILEDARSRLVRTGRSEGEWVEVLDGLAEGDRVVFDGQFALTDGSVVSVEGAEPGAAAASAEPPAAAE